MAYISGFDRNQSFLFSLNDFISDNNPVRLIDLFVDLLDLPALGFISHSPSSPGQRPYRSSDLLKLHLYGYVNGIRSSRKLAAECSRNVELMWLLNNVSPAKSCISDFIRLNKSPIHNVFKKFVDFLKFADFVDAKACVIDGSKIRAQNSRNKFFSIKKIDATISFFNSQIDKYISALQSAESSVDSDPDAIISFNQSISHYKDKLAQFHSLKDSMISNSLSQVSITDPDSRMMSSHGNSDISFNLQTSVDSKNSLMYTLRKCVVEHPFGTIKRSLGYTYFLRRGLDSVRAEATLICLAYDIKRVCNIAPFSFLKDKLKEFFLAFPSFFNLFFSSLLKKQNLHIFFFFVDFVFDFIYFLLFYFFLLLDSLSLTVPTFLLCFTIFCISPISFVSSLILA